MIGLNPGGIERKDLKILLRLAQSSAKISVLRWTAEEEERETKTRVNWLIYKNLVTNSGHNGFVLSGDGIEYLKMIHEQQKQAGVTKKKTSIIKLAPKTPKK